MIILRNKDAESLYKAFGSEFKKTYSAQSVLYSKTTDIICFKDGVIQMHSYTNQKGSIYKFIGKLERENCPFILILDRKCNIFNSKNIATVINADSIDYETLHIFLDEEDKREKNKSKLYDLIFREFVKYIDVPEKKDFSKSYSLFLETACASDLLTDDLVFIAMNAETGQIYNSNAEMGQSFDSGKIWFYNEQVNYSPKPMVESNKEIVSLETRREDTVEDFESTYLTPRGYVNGRILKEYSHSTLVEIIKRHPALFGDFVKRGYSYYSSNDNKHIAENPSLYTIEKEEEEEDEREIIEEYYEEAGKAPIGTKMCYTCNRYVSEDQVDLIMLDDDRVSMCWDCLTANQGSVLI